VLRVDLRLEADFVEFGAVVGAAADGFLEMEGLEVSPRSPSVAII